MTDVFILPLLALIVFRVILRVELSDFSVYPDYETMTYIFLVEPMKEDTGVDTQQLTECVYKHMRKANGEFDQSLEHAHDVFFSRDRPLNHKAHMIGMVIFRIHRPCREQIISVHMEDI